jgi:hypothetical protein
VAPTPNRYQLVIQFPSSFFDTFDAMIAFEDRLIRCMPRTCEVDGHDIGSGTTNFFIRTPAPLSAHRAFCKYLGTRNVMRQLRIAYRPLDGEDFTNIWPRRDPRPFLCLYPPDQNPFAPASKRQIPKRTPRAPAAKSTVAKRVARTRA